MLVYFEDTLTFVMLCNVNNFTKISFQGISVSKIHYNSKEFKNRLFHFKKHRKIYFYMKNISLDKLQIRHT